VRIILAIILFFSITSHAWAGADDYFCWRPADALDNLRDADVVFTGKVIQIDQWKKDKNELNTPRLNVYFEVEDIWKGIPAGEQYIQADTETKYKYRFEKDQTYLVYAYKMYPNRISMVGCPRIKQVGDVRKDLLWLGQPINQATELQKILEKQGLNEEASSIDKEAEEIMAKAEEKVKSEEATKKPTEIIADTKKIEAAKVEEKKVSDVKESVKPAATAAKTENAKPVEKAAAAPASAPTSTALPEKNAEVAPITQSIPPVVTAAPEKPATTPAAAAKAEEKPSIAQPASATKTKVTAPAAFEPVPLEEFSGNSDLPSSPKLPDLQ
jgi:hypothetical protein